MTDPLDLETLFHERREWAEKTLRPITVAQTSALLDHLFATNITHPWYAQAQEFLADHGTRDFLRGELPSGYAFVYSPEKQKGFWFKFTDTLEAIGPIGMHGISILSELMTAKGLA